MFPSPRSRLRIWSRATGSVIPSSVSLLVLRTKAESGAHNSRNASRFPRRRRPHIANCRHVCMVTTDHSRILINRARLLIPARCKLNRGDGNFPIPFRSRLRIRPREIGSAVPSRPSPLIPQAESGTMLTINNLFLSFPHHTVDHHHWRIGSRLTRDGAAEPISRGRILRRERKGIGRKTFFLFS